MVERKLPDGVRPQDVEGLRGIAEERGISIEEAGKIALADLRETKSDEHIEPVQRAIEFLTGQRP